MLKIKTTKPILKKTVDEEVNYQLIPRRREDRRRTDRRVTNGPKKRPQQIRRIRGMDDMDYTPIRFGERRKADRRKSRPKLLSADEIILLRKS